ncbi:MAG: hypothetical protein V1722_05150 [Candidatus Micrarchaeota archaeon]
MTSEVKMYSNQDIDLVLRKASAYLNKQVEAFLIGGCAMTFRNLKPATKDADLLLEDELSEQRLFQALRQAGLEELFPGSYQQDVKAKDILIAENGLQFDLFAKIVMDGLNLSKGMKRRAEKHAKYGNLKVFIASKEDIFLFKAITNRPYPRDFEDMITLQQSGLKWPEVISEYEAQIKGKQIEQNLKKKLTDLKQTGYVNPLMKKLNI